MTKELRKKLNLSKQICKICNLQPKKEDDGGGWYYECYPNFLSPENFCKLIDLTIVEVYNKKLFWLVNEEYTCEDREDFLKKLYAILKGTNLPNYYREPIKQSIREAEWKYE